MRDTASSRRSHHLYFVALLLILPFAEDGFGIDFLPPSTVGTGGYSSIAVDRTGHWHLVYTHHDNQTSFLSYTNESLVAPSVLATFPFYISNPCQGELITSVGIDVDPHGGVHVAYTTDKACSQVHEIHYLTKLATSWSPTQTIGAVERLNGFSLAADSSGAWHLAYGRLDCAEHNCLPEIGRATVVDYRRQGSSTITIASLVSSPTLYRCEDVRFPSISIDYDDNPQILYERRLDCSTSALELVRSAGDQWLAPVELGAHFRSLDSPPAFAVLSALDWHLAYAELICAPESACEFPVSYAIRYAGNISGSKTITTTILNEKALGASVFRPDVAIARDGTVHLTYRSSLSAPNIGPQLIQYVKSAPPCGNKCFDGDPCTLDECVNGNCLNVMVPNCPDDGGGQNKADSPVRVLVPQNPVEPILVPITPITRPLTIRFPRTSGGVLFAQYLRWSLGLRQSAASGLDANARVSIAPSASESGAIEAPPDVVGRPSDPAQLWYVYYDGDASGEVIVELSYDREALLSGVRRSDLALYRLVHREVDEWVELDGNVDADLDGITVSLENLSPAVLALGIRKPLRLSGRVSHYFSGHAVSGVVIGRTGRGSQESITNEVGDYAFADVEPELITVAASKHGDVVGAVSSLDGAFAAQHRVGLRELSVSQQLACDVSGNGKVTSLDAALILRFAVGLITPLGGGGATFPVVERCNSDWAFVPSAAAVSNQTLVPFLADTSTCQAGAIRFDQIVGDAVDQDFDAIPFGDCTGNWMQITVPAK